MESQYASEFADYQVSKRFRTRTSPKMPNAKLCCIPISFEYICFENCTEQSTKVCRLNCQKCLYSRKCYIPEFGYIIPMGQKCNLHELLAHRAGKVAGNNLFRRMLHVDCNEDILLWPSLRRCSPGTAANPVCHSDEINKTTSLLYRYLPNLACSCSR